MCDVVKKRGVKARGEARVVPVILVLCSAWPRGSRGCHRDKWLREARRILQLVGLAWEGPSRKPKGGKGDSPAGSATGCRDPGVAKVMQVMRSVAAVQLSGLQCWRLKG